MKKKLVPANKSIDEVKEIVRNSAATTFDPRIVLSKIEEELAKSPGEVALTPESDLFKAVTLFEFDNGVLMTTGISNQYKTFAIDLSRQFQQEYGCKTYSERATAELAAINYVRTIDIQKRIKNYLEMGTITNAGVQFLGVLSKELDRANRHYLTAIQTLRMTKQLPMHVNVKTQTAVIGQNQIVQSNNL